jgi:N utilization substance protein A
MDVLDCDEVIAHLLVTEGFAQVSELGNCSIEDLATVEGFDEALSEELITRARVYLEQKDKKASEKVKEMKIDKRLPALGVLSNEMLVKLAENKISDLEALADLSGEELTEILPTLGLEAANGIIMKAREHWFVEK